MTPLFFILFFAFFVATWMGSPLLRNGLFRVFRIFFPSWRFFEAITPIPKIYFRTSADGKTYSSWHELQRLNQQRRIVHLIHNPIGNLELTYQTQIEQLLNDIAEDGAGLEKFYEDLTSFKIVSLYVQQLIRTHHPEETFHSFQFKIGVFEFSPPHKKHNPRWTDALISPPLEMGP